MVLERQGQSEDMDEVYGETVPPTKRKRELHFASDDRLLVEPLHVLRHPPVANYL